MTEQQQGVQPMESEEDEVQAEEISFEQRFKALEAEFLPEGVTFIPPDCICLFDHDNIVAEKDNMVQLLLAQARRLKAQLKAVRAAAKNME
jgi:hypothetical protein